MLERAFWVTFVTWTLMSSPAPGCSQTAEVRRDAQSSFEPRSGPGAGQKFLEAFVGDWDVVKTFHPRSGGQPVRTPGTCRQTLIHDGRFLRSEFVFEQGGRQSTGLGLTGFDPPSGRFTTVWTDSRQTRMSMRQSQEPFDGEQIVLFARSLDDQGRASASPSSRTITRLEDSGRTIRHRQFTSGPDGEEHLIMELVMTRKARNAASGR
jgi:hypothetical protein